MRMSTDKEIDYVIDKFYFRKGHKCEKICKTRDHSPIACSKIPGDLQQARSLTL